MPTPFNSTKPISDSAAIVLGALRRSAEQPVTDADGARWGSVYLDNAKPAGMSTQAFHGYLSALQTAGLYKPQDGWAFGDVRLAY